MVRLKEDRRENVEEVRFWRKRGDGAARVSWRRRGDVWSGLEERRGVSSC